MTPDMVKPGDLLPGGWAWAVITDHWNGDRQAAQIIAAAALAGLRETGENRVILLQALAACIRERWPEDGPEGLTGGPFSAAAPPPERPQPRRPRPRAR
jgi:hypothetical protein